MDNKVVMKSKIRLARNISNYPFPIKLDKEKSLEIIELVRSILIGDDSPFKDELEFYKMDEMGEVDKLSMVEDYLISLELASNENSAVLVNKSKTLSIMINEEDHIRIQVIYDGFALRNAYELVNQIDDLIEDKLDIAFDEDLGYLTSCPTNTGTGMKISIIMHLPALTQLKYINDVYKISSQIGITMSGIYVDKSEVIGNIYQISNQLTLGRTEDNTIDSIRGIVADIVLKEVQVREILRKKLCIKLEDKIYRSLGILKSARTIDSRESMIYLSNIKLGMEMGYIKGISFSEIDDLLISVQPAHQSMIYGSNNREDRDVNRAEFIRKKLEGLESKI